MNKTALLNYITDRTAYLDRLIYHHQCNIPEPDHQEGQEYSEAQGERKALNKIKAMIETTDAMRDRNEVEKYLHTLVGILAHNALSDDSIAGVHALALDLIWVLYPGLTTAEMFQLSDAMIAERKSGA